MSSFDPVVSINELKKRNASAELSKESFMQYVKECPTTGDWLWVGVKDKLGFGHVVHNNRYYGPCNKVSYELFIGEHGKGFPFLECGNLKCCNPDHMRKRT